MQRVESDKRKSNYFSMGEEAAICPLISSTGTILIDLIAFITLIAGPNIRLVFSHLNVKDVYLLIKKIQMLDALH